LICRSSFPTLPFMRLDYCCNDDRAEDPEPGAWSREALEAMDARFVAALEQAFELGLESRTSAAGEIKLKPSLGPRRVTPLTREIQEGLWRSSASVVFVARS